MRRTLHSNRALVLIALCDVRSASGFYRGCNILDRTLAFVPCDVGKSEFLERTTLCRNGIEDN